jgi:Ca-activated chloride channel family protein
VAGRPDDLVGLVVFANYADHACPLTLDHGFLLDSVRAVRPARAGDDGTNLGDAIIWSLNALEDAPTLKKVLILLTDGRNDPAVPNPADPETAAALARELGVTVHTIAVGRGGTVTRAVEPKTGLPLVTQVEGPDHALLAQIARAGGGRAFAAVDSDSLARVFAAIDQLEKSPVRGELRPRYRERYGPCVVLALGLLLLDRLLAAGPLGRLP